MSLPGRACAAIAGLLAAAAAVAAVPATAQTVRSPEVTVLSFQGNEAFSDSELEAVIQTRETKCATFVLSWLCAISDLGFAHRRAYLDTLAVSADALRLRTYYTLRGYFQASVSDIVRREPDRARVYFTIEEGQPTPIESLEIRGLPPTISAEEADRLIGPGTGDRFDQLLLEAGKDSLVRAMREQGHIEALILQDAQRDLGGPARITLDVSPGPRFRVGEVRIDGADAIGEGVVRDLMTIGPGQYFRPSRVEDSQRNLFGLEAVRFASITTTRQTDDGAAVADSIVDLRVQITPAATRAARGGLGWSTVECFQTEARLTNRNFFGGAKRLEVSARLTNIFSQQLGGSFPCADVGTDPDFRTLNFSLRTELAVPVFFSGRNSFRATVFGERETVPDVFIREGVGAQFAVTRRLRRDMTATLSYLPEFTGFDEQSADIFFCVNFGFCAPEDIVTVTQSRWLAPINASWLYNRTIGTIQPTGGYYLTAELENAGPLTGSEYDYFRTTIQGANFKALESDLVLGMRLRAGFVEPTRGPLSVIDGSREAEIIHPSKRFFAGGSQSVRGFGQNLLGPRVLVADQLEDCPDEFLEPCVARLAAEDPGAFQQRPIGGNASVELSFELRQTLTPIWAFVLFVDAGGVYEDIGKLKLPVWTPGFGIRYNTPIGPLRLDVGYDPSGPAELPVVVSLENGSLVELRDPVVFNPFTFDDPSLLKELWRRFQIHISIGEAF